MGLLALVVPLVLFVGLSYQLGAPVGSEENPSTQPQPELEHPIRFDPQSEIHGDVQTRPRSTPGSTSFGVTEADFTRHVNDLNAHIKKKLASPVSHGFSIVIQKPFVVIGDEPQKVVQQRAEETVKWAVDRLKQDFFTRDPEDILDIWLFKDEASYDKHALVLFADTPTTPYGYYSPTHKALIMNISTGGGTLVHEIVHPFMEANFRSLPALAQRRPGISSTNSVARLTGTFTVLLTGDCPGYNVRLRRSRCRRSRL